MFRLYLDVSVTVSKLDPFLATDFWIPRKANYVLKFSIGCLQHEEMFFSYHTTIPARPQKGKNEACRRQSVPRKSKRMKY